MRTGEWPDLGGSRQQVGLWGKQDSLWALSIKCCNTERLVFSASGALGHVQSCWSERVVYSLWVSPCRIPSQLYSLVFPAWPDSADDTSRTHSLLSPCGTSFFEGGMVAWPWGTCTMSHVRRWLCRKLFPVVATKLHARNQNKCTPPTPWPDYYQPLYL